MEITAHMIRMVVRVGHLLSALALLQIIGLVWQHGAQWFPSPRLPWRSTWMATDWQHLLTQSKLSPPTHWQLTLISSTIFREDSVSSWCIIS